MSNKKFTFILRNSVQLTFYLSWLNLYRICNWRTSHFKYWRLADTLWIWNWSHLSFCVWFDIWRVIDDESTFRIIWDVSGVILPKEFFLSYINSFTITSWFSQYYRFRFLWTISYGTPEKNFWMKLSWW